MNFDVNSIMNCLSKALCACLLQLVLGGKTIQSLPIRGNLLLLVLITSDNKLRQFSFKLLHRVLVTKKELKIFGIANDEKCEMCNGLDSIEHTFLDCPEVLKLLDASLQWFSNRHSTVLTISPYDVILNQVPTSLQLSFHLKKKLRLLTCCKSNITFTPAKPYRHQ